MDDDFGADEALLAAMAATDTSLPASRPAAVQQPTPRRLDKPPSSSVSSRSKVVQPTPQALPQKQQTSSSILVSPRQRGNPVLSSVRSMPWEYSDIPADYVLGLTTCALFLSLKYHRLHPEYIYTRIRNLQGKYNLRILLVLVDIPNHEDALRELSKTSMVNNVTIMLCWSAAEAARYIELYKSYETANFNAIRGQQSSTYADKLVDFVTVPRSLNKSDAVALVANFGSLKNAVNADPEHLSMISGWGGVKVKRWSAAMDEPFRAPKAAKKSLKKKPVATADEATGSQESARIFHLEQALPLSRVSRREVSSQVSSSRRSPAESASNTAGLGTSSAPQLHSLDQDDDLVDEQKALLAAAIKESQETSQPMYTTGTRSEAARDQEELLSGGVAAALAKLREGS